MSDNRMSKEKWVAMFREIGLDEAAMRQWHRLFERRHPAEHQAFLEWLQIPEAEIAAIRGH
jgi:hypothetical protein